AHVGLESELVARIGGVGGAIGPGEAVEYRISPVRTFLFREGIGHRKGRVVAADDLPLGGAQVLDIGIADESARAGDNILWKSRDLCQGGIEILWGIALRPWASKRREIIGESETLHLRLRLLAESAFALELRRRQGRQLQGGAERGAIAAEGQAALDDGRYHDDASHHAALPLLHDCL